MPGKEVCKMRGKPLPAQNWWKKVCLIIPLTIVLPNTLLDHLSSESACSTSGLICTSAVPLSAALCTHQLLQTLPKVCVRLLQASCLHSG